MHLLDDTRDATGAYVLLDPIGRDGTYVQGQDPDCRAVAGEGSALFSSGP